MFGGSMPATVSQKGKKITDAYKSRVLKFAGKWLQHAVTTGESKKRLIVWPRLRRRAHESRHEINNPKLDGKQWLPPDVRLMFRPRQFQRDENFELYGPNNADAWTLEHISS